MDGMYVTTLADKGVWRMTFVRAFSRDILYAFIILAIPFLAIWKLIELIF